MLKKIKEQEMPLLGRKRVVYEVDHHGSATPSRKSLYEQISNDLKTNPELIVVKHIFSKFGVNKSKVIAHIYLDKERMNFLEQKRGNKEEKKVAS